MSTVRPAIFAAIFAAALALAATAFGQDATPPQPNAPGPDVAHATPTTGPTADIGPVTPTTPVVKGVQDLLGKIVADVTTPGHAHQLADDFADPAAVRGIDWADVDAAAKAFQTAWSVRFGTTFDIPGKVSIAFTEPTMHVANPTTGPAGQPPQTPVTLTDPGRRSAVVLHCTKAGQDVKLALPPGATPSTVHDALLTHLKAVTADHDSWPTDGAQAYVYVGQKVLAGLGTAAPPR